MTVVNKILGRAPIGDYVKSLDINLFEDLSENEWYYTDVLEATITHNYVLNSDGFEKEWKNYK